MKLATTLLCGLFAFASLQTASAQNKASQSSLLEARYGANYEEVIAKYGDDPAQLLRVERELLRSRTAPMDVVASMNARDQHYIIRSEAEPNNDFGEADDLTDVLAADGPVNPGEYNGGLVEASLAADDVDVYKFTVDTTRMYYFASTHSFTDGGADGLDVMARLFHESDLDTTFVEDAGGIAGNDKMRGDIMGRNTDGRNGSGDFRLTGWVSPIDPATGDKLTGDFYLWVFNEDGNTGPYHLIAYSVPIADWVDKAEPNQTFQDALVNPDAILPTDAVVRTFMAFNPDTVKVVNPDVPTQGNSVYPQLLAQGDEDVDHFRIDAKAGHTIVIETMEYFGYYRNNDGSIGPGGTRLSDPRIRLYNADYTQILHEDDDGAREQMDGPNNIHSRIVYTPQEDGPVWLWVSAWASQTREPGHSVDNRDPGRLMYDLYATQYSNDPVEIEPNDTPEEATQIVARADTVVNGSFSGPGDEDYYRVFMHEVRMYTLFTQNSTVSDDIQIEIYHEYETENGGTALTGNLVTEAVAGNAGNNDFVLSGFVPERSGAYLVKVTSGSAGDYQLGVVDKGQIYDARIANEPDDDEATALEQAAMETGPGAVAKQGAIYPSGDVDHYHFNLNQGSDVTLTISGSQEEVVHDFDALITLFAPDGSEVGSSNSGISHSATQSGTFIVRVEAANDGDIGFYRLSGGEPFEEQEPNDDFNQANLIALNNIYEAALTADDVDFYRFRLEAGNLYSFRSLDNETAGPLTVEFFDEVNGETLLDESGWVDNYSGSNFKIANIIPSTTRTYYLKVSGSPGPYKITSRVNNTFLSLKDKGEPNNSPEEADARGSYNAFGVDEPFALFDESHPRWFGDEDWFRVDVSAGQTLVAETKPFGGDMWNQDTDTRIVLHVPDGDGVVEVANDDDGGNGWYSLASHTATEDGVVYVQVRTSRTPDAADDRSMNRGDYYLNVSLTSQEVEPNNSFAEADANVLRSGVVDASFDTDTDPVDIYRLDLEADHTYNIRTIRPEGGFTGAFSAKLYKGSDTGTNLLNEASPGYNSRYSGSNVKLNIMPDQTETYYLHLEGEGSGAYQVAMKSRDISELKSVGEPNNTVAEADAIGTLEFDSPGVPRTYMLYNADYEWTAGMPITAQFSDDIDIYRYELEAGDTLVAETSPVDGSLWTRDFDAYMRLLGAAGDTLVSDDDGGQDWHSRIQYTAEEAGVYYVMVHGQDWGGPTDTDPSRGEYNLTVLKLDGTVVSIDTEEVEVPETFALGVNYPNPFNPSTTITYQLPRAADVRLTVYNVLGQLVATLVDSHQAAGQHAAQFDASNLASGVYLYHLQAEDFNQTRMMTLVK